MTAVRRRCQVPPPRPEVVLGAIPVASGASAGFGCLCANTQNDVTFTIENHGPAELHLTGAPEPVTIAGPDASLFTLLSQPVSPILGGGGTSFTVRFSAPTASQAGGDDGDLEDGVG